jgi:hypothetical protein
MISWLIAPLTGRRWPKAARSIPAMLKAIPPTAPKSEGLRLNALGIEDSSFLKVDERMRLSSDLFEFIGCLVDGAKFAFPIKGTRRPN